MWEVIGFFPRGKPFFRFRASIWTRSRAWKYTLRTERIRAVSTTVATRNLSLTDGKAVFGDIDKLCAGAMNVMMTNMAKEMAVTCKMGLV